jgi:site-specific DNA-methyltransferase (adenine-specific)
VPYLQREREDRVKPYYEHAGITIYHGDCRDILPNLNADILITDPPYGYRFSSNRDSSHRGQEIKNDHDTSARDYAIEISGEPWACFGSWKVTPPAGAKTAIVWDKGPASGMGDLSIPWKCSWEIIWIAGSGWSGKRDEGVLRGHRVITWESRGRLHINEKPITLLGELIRKAPPGIIIDPFIGSGTTLRAAKDLGRRAIGIEIEEKYCEIAAKRLAQEVLF